MDFRNDFVGVFLDHGISKLEMNNMSDAEFQTKLNSFLDDNYVEQTQSRQQYRVNAPSRRMADIDGFGNGSYDEEAAMKAAIEASLEDALIAPHLRPLPDPRNEIVHDDVRARDTKKKRSAFGGVPKELQPKPTPLPAARNKAVANNRVPPPTKIKQPQQHKAPPARAVQQPANGLANAEQIQAKPKKDNVLANKARGAGVASPMFPNIPQREARQAKQPAKKLAHVEQIQAKPKKDNALANKAQTTGVASPTFPNIPQREARQVKLPEQKPRITRKVNHEQVKPVAPEKNLPRVIPSNLHDNHVSKPVKKESKPVTPSFQSRPTTTSRSSARDSSRQAKIQEKKDIYDERVTLPDLPTVDDLPKHVHDEFDIDDAPRIEDPEPKPAKIPSDLRKSHNERNMQDYEYMQILEEQERLEREKERKEEEERRREKEEKAKAKKSEMSNQALLDEAYSKLPPEPSAGVTIAVMLFNKRIMRKFLPQEPGIDVYAWIAKESNGKLFLNNFEIAPVGGQKVEKEQTLEEQNIKGRTMLMITDI